MPDFPLSADAAATARCALDPEAAAQAICARCGNFMCARCTDFGQYDVCPTCRALTGDVPGLVWTRDNLTFDGIWSFTWEHFKREWLMLSLSVLVMGVMLFGIGLVSNVGQAVGKAIHPGVEFGFLAVGQILQTTLQSVLTGGLCVVMFGVFKGTAADVGKMFGQFSRLGTYIALMLVEFAMVLLPLMVIGGIAGGTWFFTRDNPEIAIAVGVGLTLLLAVPMIWLWLPFDYAMMEVALGGETSGVQAIKNAFVLARGKRLWMFLVTLVGVPLALAGMAACCVGLLPAVALAQLLKVTLYLVLRNGSGLPPMRGELN